MSFQWEMTSLGDSTIWCIMYFDVLSFLIWIPKNNITTELRLYRLTQRTWKAHLFYLSTNRHAPPPPLSLSLLLNLLRSKRAFGGVERLRLWPAGALRGLAQQGCGTCGRADPPCSAAMPPPAHPQRRRKGGCGGPGRAPSSVPHHPGGSLSLADPVIHLGALILYACCSQSQCFVFGWIKGAHSQFFVRLSAGNIFNATIKQWRYPWKKTGGRGGGGTSTAKFPFSRNTGILSI